MHLARQLASRGLLQQTFDEEKQILATSIETRGSDAVPIQSVQCGQQFAFIFDGQKPAAGQHARMGVVDLQQRVQEILLSVFEVVRKNGLGVNGRGEGIGHPVPS